MDILRISMDIPANILGFIGPLTATLLLGITTIVLLFWYSFQKQSYWKNLGVPYVKPLPFFGSLLENMKKPLHYTEWERYNKFGRLYGHYEGNRPILSVGEPKILRNILVKDFHAFTGRRRFEIGNKMVDSMLINLQGEDWKRVRTIVTTTFTTGKIKRLLSILKDCSRTLVKNFRDTAEKGEPVEAKRLYGAFTMDVIASSAFSTKIDSHNDPQNEFVRTARESISVNFSWIFLIFILFPGLIKIFRLRIFRPKPMVFFMKAAMDIIEERKKTNQTRNDFLQLLLDTTKEVAEEGKLDAYEKDGDITDNYGKEENDLILKNIPNKKNLSIEEVVAQCVIFFMAGYATTVSTLSFATYLLALNPDIQEKVIKELDDVLKENNGELTYEAIQSMKYFDNVISEILRMYPPGTRMERVADEDYQLGDTGLTVPKDMVITIPVYAMHRDPDFFPDPEKFDPDRFLPEERAKRDQYCYMPFGVGPRNCVAMRFALMEIKVCLAHVLSNFRIKKCSKTKVPLDFYTSQVGMEPREINVLFEIRKDTLKAL